jgi:hypothetical protein
MDIKMDLGRQEDVTELQQFQAVNLPVQNGLAVGI